DAGGLTPGECVDGHVAGRRADDEPAEPASRPIPLALAPEPTLTVAGDEMPSLDAHLRAGTEYHRPVRLARRLRGSRLRGRRARWRPLTWCNSAEGPPARWATA